MEFNAWVEDEDYKKPAQSRRFLDLDIACIPLMVAQQKAGVATIVCRDGMGRRYSKHVKLRHPR